MDRTAVGALGFSYPASVASREWLDQNGDPYLLKTMSSWGMAQNLSNANITTALEGLKARGFNAVTVGLPGQSYGGDWARYENAAGDQYFATVAGGNMAGTPWSSELGAAWSTFDHIMDEATRLGMTVVISLYTGFGTMGCEADIISAGTTAMYDFGVALATRYANYPNVVWHIGADDNWVYNNGPGSVVDSFYDGIRDAEGSTHRLWVAEPNNGSTSYAQWTSAFTGTGGFTYFRLNANNVYDYGDNSVDQFDAVYTEPGATTYPVWDAEPPYVGAPHYGGNERQQLRERNYATFIRGGIGINYGHEDWWSFDYSDLFDAPGTNSWTEVPTEPELYDAEHAWALLDTYRSDATWAPDAGSFLKTGVGSGDTKAASGYSNTAALVYFPSSRTIVVDTTVLAGTDNVRLRWFDPTDGTYDVIANSEAQSASRSIAYPGNNAAGQGDWVLVIDTANTAPPSTTT
ncbi:MAG TPA: DUF4038 domain-containing protein, partial [Ilumatobacteraceae bacterium]|nr:DUF4038 domain-containing protein [Ilumatobacteraceae bacterium]